MYTHRCDVCICMDLEVKGERKELFSFILMDTIQSVQYTEEESVVKNPREENRKIEKESEERERERGQNKCSNLVNGRKFLGEDSLLVLVFVLEFSRKFSKG